MCRLLWVCNRGDNGYFFTCYWVRAWLCIWVCDRLCAIARVSLTCSFSLFYFALSSPLTSITSPFPIYFVSSLSIPISTALPIFPSFLLPPPSPFLFIPSFPHTYTSTPSHPPLEQGVLGWATAAAAEGAAALCACMCVSVCTCHSLSPPPGCLGRVGPSRVPQPCQKPTNQPGACVLICTHAHTHVHKHLLQT